MTMSKGGSQEASGKTRGSSNTLNPDAPEFNPRSKSTGKLNANAPEFVPGQLHNFESVMLNMPEMKGYKNGHMPTYTLSHQEQCVPVWVPQAYPVNVPIQHFYGNAPIDLLSCDFTQTQNYPIQRNVYPTQPHNDYHLNPPYNVVAQGKSKLNNKSTKTKTTTKDTGAKESARDHSRDKEAGSSARDNISVATTKDTTRETAVTLNKEATPEPNKPLTWAERTKLSTRQPQKPTVTTSVNTTVHPSSTIAKEVPKDTVKEHRHTSREVGKEHRDSVKDTGSHRERSDRDKKESRDGKNKERDRMRYDTNREKEDRDLEEHEKEDKKNKDTTVKTYGRDYREQASYAKVFKDAVKSSAAKEVPKEPRPEVRTEPVKEVSRSPASTVATSKEVTSTVSSEVGLKVSTSTDSASTVVDKVEVSQVSDSDSRVAATAVTQDSTHLEEKKPSEKDSSDEYTVNSMLGYYVYLLKNRKMVDEIRDKYQLPRISFSTTSSTGTFNKTSYKDRERDRDKGDREHYRDRDRSDRDRDRDRDKTDKKDWRNKSYDKNFGNNFRFNNKEFSRASNEFTPAVVASESSWVIKQAKQKSDKEAVLRRKIMGLLNRLTFEKFDIIYKQIIECGIDTPEHAEMLVRFVFEKAVTQHHFIPMYVELCAKLAIDLYTIDNGASANGAAAPCKATTSQTDSSCVLRNGETAVAGSVKEVCKLDAENKVTQDSTHLEEQDEDKNAVEKRSDESDQLHESEDKDNAENSVGQSENKEKTEDKNKEKQTSANDQSVETAKCGDVTANSSLEGASLNPDELVDPKTNRKSDFMRILLNCSQDSFEDNLKPLEIPAELEGDDKFEFEQKYKHKMRGNMIFVGELFKQKLLAAKLLITCLDQVFSKREECILLYDDVNMGNNHLEAMCTLLQTVGRSFDTNRWKHLSEFEKRIQHLEDLGKNELISFRIRCLIKNVLDSRMERWDKSIYQKQDQPCKLQELRHKHSSSSFNLLSAANNSSSNLNLSTGSNRDNYRDRDKKESRDDRDEVWRMRNRKNKSTSNLVAFGKTEKNRKEMSRNMSREAFSESTDSRRADKGDREHYRDRDRSDRHRKKTVESELERKKTDKERDKSDLEDSELDKLEDLEEEEEGVSELEADSRDLSDEHLDDYESEDVGYDSNNTEDSDRTENNENTDAENDTEKLCKNVRSIVSELVLSHDVEESSTRVEELNLEETKFNDFYRLLVVTCMEKCSKVNADKESVIVTKWIVDLAKQQDTMSNLVEGLHEFVFGEDESSMNMLVEDFPLLPNTLKLLLDNMNSECENNQKFKEILAQI